MTYAGTSTAPDVKIYLDGVLESTSINNDSLASTILTDISPTFGKRDGGSLYFEGNIDELKVYDYERTQEQIIEDMNAGHPAPGSPIGSPVGWWKFDEGYGDTANDSGPQGNNGNLQGACPGGGNCPTWTEDGKFGKALDYDGNDYIVVTDDSSLRPENGSWSVSVWAKPDDANQTGPIIAKRQNSDPFEAWGLYICGNTTCLSSGQKLMSLFIEDDNTTDRRAISDIDVADGNWHHYTMVADKDSDFIKLYMDGLQLLTSTYVVGSWPTVNNPDDLNIGRNNGSLYFSGAIDETKVYNFALSAAQVSAEYNQGKAAVFGALSTTAGGSAPSYSASREYCPPGDSNTCSTPVALYKFDEKTGSNAYDTSTNNYIGSITGAQWEPALFCKLGACLSFNGSSDYVDIGVGPGAVRSMEMWVYPETTTEYLLDLTDYITADEWHHVTVTTSTSENATDFDIGRTAGSNYVQGKMDQVVLYDYVRTPAQIAWSYNKGGPVGWWKFDECQGTTAYDSSGKGNNGTILAGSGPNGSVGTCYSGAGDEMWDNGTTGKISSSLDFDGSDDYVDIDNNSSINGLTFSYSFWAKPATVSGTFSLVSARESGGGGNGGAVHMINDDLRFQVNLSGTNRTITALNSLSQDVWHHIVATYNDDSIHMDLYINGALVGSADPDQPNGPSAVPLTIGASQLVEDSPQEFYNGLLDEVKIFNYVLKQNNEFIKKNIEPNGIPDQVRNDNG
jgi:hypothetical protein